MQKLDFSGFKADLSNGQQAALVAEKGPFINALRLLLAIVGVISFPFISLFLFAVFPIFATIIYAAALIALLVRANRRRQGYERQFGQFISNNGWVSGGQAPLIPIVEKAGYRLSKVHIQGKIDGQKFWLYDISPPVINQQNLDALTLLSIEFPKLLPSLLLFPGASILKPIVDSMAKSVFGLVNLSLEGDFNRHIAAYYAPGEQIDSLSYLTPDVMEVVVKKVHSIVLYSGQFLSVSSTEPFNNIDELKDMFKSAQLLAKEVKEKQNLL